ncbi:hypothetical protein FGO68_gene6314 [Halteria grandinella]|uniref:Uncharacterized protein n=1 Tax=Halteria grandinella TaxID=5974 RepID=A0A8J8N9F0_HALGN|nr:hypothetical protein FGO68_gene6314 [Halteria grandinella]
MSTQRVHAIAQVLSDSEINAGNSDYYLTICGSSSCFRLFLARAGSDQRCDRPYRCLRLSKQPPRQAQQSSQLFISRFRYT